MQKGKRYKDTLGQTWRFTHTSGDGVTLYFKVEGSTTLLSHPVPPHDLKWLVDSGQWVELPDDDQVAVQYQHEGRWVTGDEPAHCDHTWVNYTPYHDASPMAKFACRHCNRDRD